MIPVSVIELDESYSSFHQPSCQQTVSRKARLLWILDAVQIQRLLALIAGVHQFRCTGLHAIRHFVSVDASCNLFITGFGQPLGIQLANSLENLHLLFLANRFRRG